MTARRDIAENMIGGTMSWIMPHPVVLLKFLLFFCLAFENSRYVAALRSGSTRTLMATTPTSGKFIIATYRVALVLMPVFLVLHWYDFGFWKTLGLFGITIVASMVISGVLLASAELYFREAWWALSSLLLYPSALWLALSFSWFGYFQR